MNFDYPEMAECAKDIISEYGQKCVLSKLSAGTFDGVLGAHSGRSEVLYDINAVVDNFAKNTARGRNILAGQKLLYVESEIEPEINNTIKTGEIKNRVISVDILSPAGTVLLYEVVVMI